MIWSRVLPAREPPGLFFFRRQIGGDALEPGETLLFCYRGSIRYVAKAETGRMDSPSTKRDDYPHCFVINLQSVRATDLPLAVVERQLQEKAALTKSMQGRAWT
jgi:hypothetical protein